MDKNKNDKVKKVFGLFRQPRARQNKVYNQIRENAKGDFDFYLMMVFAGIIITLGILIDSSAVVIGGMLLAPVVWPILALAMGISMGRAHLMRVSFFTLIKVVLLTVIISAIIGFLVPDIVIENNQLFSRTSPTLIEFIIGLAAGFIGAFVIVYPRLGSSIAGVVVAAAIVPPITTIGITIANYDLEGAAGASLLLISQLIAIVFSASILFLISSFRSTSERAEEKRSSGFSWTVLLLVIVIVPLIFLTKQTTQDVKYTRIVKEVITASMEDVTISTIDISQGQEEVYVHSVVRYNKDITSNEVTAIETILSKRVQKPVTLSLQIIPIIEADINLFDKLQNFNLNTIKPTEIEITNQSVSDELYLDFVRCPIVLNGKSIIRFYPINIGCPVCSSIISCGDGREFPSERLDLSSGLCVEVDFDEGAPCLDKFEENK